MLKDYDEWKEKTEFNEWGPAIKEMINLKRRAEGKAPF
jgi:hypothetical protein